MEAVFIVGLWLNPLGLMLCIFGGVALVIAWFLVLPEDGEAVKPEDRKRALRIFKPAVVPFILGLMIISVPKPKKLVSIRLDLMKYHAVSPENVKAFTEKGLPHIERVVKKIECKYLGCDEKK